MKQKLIRNPALWPAALQVCVQLLFRPRRVRVWRDGFRITCGTGVGQGLWCAIAGRYYDPEISWMLTHLQPGDVMIDVGANVGIYTLHAARRVGPSGRVVAFEPGADAMALLRQNVQNNGMASWVDLRQKAVSSEDRSVFLGGIEGKWSSYQITEQETGLSVRTERLDDLLPDLQGRKVRLLKVDAEGFETEVFKGGGGLIEMHRPAVIFEDFMQREDRPALRFLEERGYRAFQLDGGGSLVPYQKGKSDNVVALPVDVGHSRSMEG